MPHSGDRWPATSSIARDGNGSALHVPISVSGGRVRAMQFLLNPQQFNGAASLGKTIGLECSTCKPSCTCESYDAGSARLRPHLGANMPTRFSLRHQEPEIRSYDQDISSNLGLGVADGWITRELSDQHAACSSEERALLRTQPYFGELAPFLCPKMSIGGMSTHVFARQSGCFTRTVCRRLHLATVRAQAADLPMASTTHRLLPVFGE